MNDKVRYAWSVAYRPIGGVVLLDLQSRSLWVCLAPSLAGKYSALRLVCQLSEE
jgi:hypothetical protein